MGDLNVRITDTQIKTDIQTATEAAAAVVVAAAPAAAEGAIALATVSTPFDTINSHTPKLNDHALCTEF